MRKESLRLEVWLKWLYNHEAEFKPWFHKKKKKKRKPYKTLSLILLFPSLQTSLPMRIDDIQVDLTKLLTAEEDSNSSPVQSRAKKKKVCETQLNKRKLGVV
jgi:hypothetical protein